jgi:methionyl-tRNA synthetase
MTKPFYITTPIYYVNDVPHLGHAYTTIVADALARFHRMRGDDVHFLTGTDEHGQKVEEAATKRGLTPQALVDEVAPRFAEAWRALGLSNDDFIRTTEERHKRVVTALWHRIAEKSRDDLYLATYSGWYCVGCEAFYTESQLVKLPAHGDAWCCATHERPVAWLAKERSWFFRLSKYKAQLVEHIERHPHFIQPEAYRNEVLGFLRGEVRDLSVSRTSFAWGIPVPEADPEGQQHVMYVWLDALTNYVSALGGFAGDDPAYDTYWRSAVHLIGKDILRFHAVYWPCFLMAADLPLPRTILAHGWWKIGGRKISKSIPATRISAVALAADLGATSTVPETGIDAIRYFLMRETPLGNDGDLIFEGLIERYNADLANDLGNLINRTLTMMTRFAGQAAPHRDPALAALEPHASVGRVAAQAVRDAQAAWEAYAPSRALEATWRLVREVNRYVDATQPWALAKQGKDAELAHVLHTFGAALWWLRLIIAPALPATARTLDGWLGGIASEDSARWPADPDAFGVDVPPLTLSGPQPLFPRIDDKRGAALVAGWLPPDLVEAPAAAPAPVEAPATPAPVTDRPPITVGPPVSFDDFMKTELRVAHVLAAIAVPKAKKLLQLTVDVGEGRHRTVVAGLAERFAPEALVGQKVILVANLAPATIRGITSEGMVLAVGDDTILGLAGVPADAPPGTRIR